MERRNESVQSPEEIALEAIRRSQKPRLLGRAISGPIQPAHSALGGLLCGRHSTRTFCSKPIEQHKLERVLVDSAGGVSSLILEANDLEMLYRTIPQSGGITSVALWLILLRDAGRLKIGLYAFCPHSNSLHSLAKVVSIDQINPIMQFPRKNYSLENATAILVISSDLDAKSYKYSARGHRYALVEVGCALQNALLSMTDQGISGYPYGGFDDQRLADLLNLSFPMEAPFISVVMGISVD